jgi:hypothetical protein
MKVIDLRIERIEPEMGEEVTVETNEYTYSCIVEESKDLSCDGCLLDRLRKCEHVLCCGRYRIDRNDIILKCI